MNVSSRLKWIITSTLIALPLSAQAHRGDVVLPPTDRVRPAVQEPRDREVIPGRDGSAGNPGLEPRGDRRRGADWEDEAEAGPEFTTVPEPATLVLLATGLALLVVVPMARRLRGRRQG